MRSKIFSASAAILAPAFLLGSGLGSAAAAPLDVAIEGVEARGGTLFVSVQTEAQFMGDDWVAGERVEGPTDGTLRLTLDVPPGDYAVTVWHDDDGDGAFSMAPTGMPLDGWAMSGNPRGMPSFGAAKVEVDEAGGATSMTMTYGR